MPAPLVLLWIIAFSSNGFFANAQDTAIHVPLAGNCFITSSNNAADSISEEGITNWQSPSSIFSVYVRSTVACKVRLGLEVAVPEGNSLLQLTAGGEIFSYEVSSAYYHNAWVEKDILLQPGYTKIDLQGLRKTGAQFAYAKNLLIKTVAPDSMFYFVRENSGNRFYWGRRGPSLHLSYELPADKKIAWFYTELTVPQHMDAIGAYFMADGFKEGYFGMQVNSATERRILFSVWSPFNTEDPAAIPEAHKIKLLRKGDRTHTGEFGNEGAGGQSYFIYPWKAGNTYKFLLHAAPDIQNSTVYTAYFFAPEENKWQLVASFRRPQTNTYLTRLHSFIENFIDTNGFLTRRCNYGNQWVVDTDKKWYELTKATFTGDDIANIQYRMDYSGGMQQDFFFLQNGGFINDHVPLKKIFTRQAYGKHPVIDFDALP